MNLSLDILSILTWYLNFNLVSFGDMICFTVGINRLLGNNTYEAAFPPHEVRRCFFLFCAEKESVKL